MAAEKEKPGGTGRGQGRKPKPEGEATVVATVRLTPSRRDKLKRLGAAWLSRAIDQAKEHDA
jgi:hypothetical protein